MDGIVTLAERHRLKLSAMVAALPRLDAALAAYAQSHGGRFIRFGSSATGALRATSDVDVIAEFPDHGAAIAACDDAEAQCHRLGLVPDIRPAEWCSDTLLARARATGITLP